MYINIKKDNLSKHKQSPVTKFRVADTDPFIQNKAI